MALLHPQFGRLRLLLLSLLLELLAHLLVGEPVQLLAGLLTVDHLQPDGCKWFAKYSRFKQGKIMKVAHHFAGGASLLRPLFPTGSAKLCVHEAHLTRDGLSQHRQSCGVVSLQRSALAIQNGF